MKIISIRLTDEEHAAMKAVCAREFLTTSAYIRRHFNLRAEELGVLNTVPGVPAKPTSTGAALARTLDDIIFDDEPQEN